MGPDYLTRFLYFDLNINSSIFDVIIIIPICVDSNKFIPYSVWSMFIDRLI